MEFTGKEILEVDSFPFESIRCAADDSDVYNNSKPESGVKNEKKDKNPTRKAKREAKKSLLRKVTDYLRKILESKMDGRSLAGFLKINSTRFASEEGADGRPWQYNILFGKNNEVKITDVKSLNFPVLCFLLEKFCNIDLQDLRKSVQNFMKLDSIENPGEEANGRKEVMKYLGRLCEDITDFKDDDDPEPSSVGEKPVLTQALSKTTAKPETHHSVKILLLLIENTARSVREVFKQKLKGKSLEAFLNENQKRLSKCQHCWQYRKLFDTKNGDSVKINDFQVLDLRLLYFLMIYAFDLDEKMKQSLHQLNKRRNEVMKRNVSHLSEDDARIITEDVKKHLNIVCDCDPDVDYEEDEVDRILELDHFNIEPIDTDKGESFFARLILLLTTSTDLILETLVNLISQEDLQKKLAEMKQKRADVKRNDKLSYVLKNDIPVERWSANELYFLFLHLQLDGFPRKTSNVWIKKNYYDGWPSNGEESKEKTKIAKAVTQIAEMRDRVLHEPSAHIDREKFMKCWIPTTDSFKFLSQFLGKDSTEVESQLIDILQTHTIEYWKLHKYFVEKRCYPLKKKNLGKCLIINIVQYDEKEEMDRTGSDVDEKLLKLTFTMFGLDVEVLEDQDKTYQGVTQRFQKIKDETDGYSYTDSSLFVCCILSHGEADCMKTRDNKKIKVEDLVEAVVQNKKLMGKPKLFFMQMCRVSEPQDDDDDDLQCDGRDYDFYSSGTELCYTDAMDPPKEKNQMKCDVLKAWPTYSENYAARSNKSGSKYINNLCRLLYEHRGKRELLWVLTKVNHDMSTKEYNMYSYHVTKDKQLLQKYQIPELSCTFTKMMWFDVVDKEAQNLLRDELRNLKLIPKKGARH